MSAINEQNKDGPNSDEQDRDRKPMWWHLIDRAYKMMEMSGYRVVEHNPDQNDPIAAWMSDARIMLRSIPEETLATSAAPAVKACRCYPLCGCETDGTLRPDCWPQ